MSLVKELGLITPALENSTPELVFDWTADSKRYRVFKLKPTYGGYQSKCTYVLETCERDCLGGDRWVPTKQWNDNESSTHHLLLQGIIAAKGSK